MHQIFDINVQDLNGDTPLHIACRRLKQQSYYGDRKTDVVYHLLSKHCNLNIQNNQGELPLHIILQLFMYDDNDTWKELHCFISADKSLSINAQNREGNTPLHLVCTL